MKLVQALIGPDGDGVALSLSVTEGALERMRGLLGRPAPAPACGLQIVPCNMVHTVGMGYPIDVLFLNKNNIVVRIDAVVGVWRFLFCWEGHSIIEMAAGEADRLRIRSGDVMRIR